MITLDHLFFSFFFGGGREILFKARKSWGIQLTGSYRHTEFRTETDDFGSHHLTF